MIQDLAHLGVFVLGSLCKHHVIHHLLILFNQSLGLQFLESEFLIDLQFILLDCASGSQNGLLLLEHTDRIEEVGFEIQVVDDLEAFKVVGFPESYFSVSRTADHLGLGFEEEEAHDFGVVVDVIVADKQRPRLHVIDHNIPLLPAQS